MIFILYLNDLPNCLDSAVPTLFADDTNLTISGATVSQIQDKLETELNKVHMWFFGQ